MNEPQQGVPEAGAHRLPVSKLRGVPQMARVRLKSLRITTCGQLLAAAATPVGRERLAAATGMDPALLLQLVRRADLARIKGIGTVFGLMLEALGVDDVGRLARQDATALHRALLGFNQAERLARRSPTPGEVAEWVEAARNMRHFVIETPPATD